MWDQVVVPVVAPLDWTRIEIRDGLAQLERLRRCVDAACARLIAGLGGGRDAAAEVARATGVSTQTARRHTRVAEVVASVDGAGEALAAGDVSSEHLTALAGVADAAELLPLALVQTPEEFARTVSRFQLDRDGAGVADRQRAARSVRFFAAEHGCIGMRAVLTPIEGAELRNRLTQLCDEAWRAVHPERAAVLGGHNAPPLEKRLADALMVLARGEGAASAKPAIVVVIDADTLDADVVGEGPVPLGEVLAMVDRSDLYAAIRSASGGILKFGRSRRLASPLQRLAVIVRDRQCVFDGCDCRPERCEVHHIVEVEHGGLTDVDELALLCKPHHHHLHLHGLKLVRDGPNWMVVAADDPRR